jgi:hypothetical protein
MRNKKQSYFNLNVLRGGKRVCDLHTCRDLPGAIVSVENKSGLIVRVAKAAGVR